MMDGQSTPEEWVAQLRDVLGPRELFAALVDALEDRELPQRPLIWYLKLWGAAHGFYHAAQVPPANREELRALLERLQATCRPSPDAPTAP
jgi:hypothetical protein